MASTLNKQTMLTMSTTHVSEKTAERLDDWASGRDDMGVPVYAKDDYGWFIYLDCLKDEMYLSKDNLPRAVVEHAEAEHRKLNPYGFLRHQNLPGDLVKCLMFAIHSGADILCLDEDEEPLRYLDTYDW